MVRRVGFEPTKDTGFEAAAYAVLLPAHEYVPRDSNPDLTG